MTLYDLTQAIVRYKRALLVGLGVLVFLVLVLTFSFEDGGIGWRGSAKYESSFQISLILPGTKSLSEPRELDGNLQNAAEAYANLLASGEAAEVIGEMSDFVLKEPLSADAGSDTGLINASVIGPSSELAVLAARNSFAWLADKIQQPLEALPPITAAPPASSVVVDGPFPSSISVELDDSLGSVSTDIFVLVDVGENQQIAVPVSERAGTLVSAAAILEPIGSIVLNLEKANGTPYDVLRLSPDPPPRSAPAYPNLAVRLGPASIRPITDDDEEQAWFFASEAITVEWIAGTPESQPVAGTSQQIQVAMLTDEPTALQIGGRRGPLIGFAVLLVGLIGLLTAVIVADTWQRESDERAVSTVRMPSEATEDKGLPYTLEMLPDTELDVADPAQPGH